MNLTPLPVQHSVKNIRFLRRGEVVNLGNVPPDRTLLDLLREDLGLSGTKEGCGEGDCGACTVVLGQVEDGALRFRAINSCIRLAHSIDGMALWTVEDLAAPDGTLHPAQEAMLQCHASQCGFCTPGFVMSLFGMYENHARQGQPITRALAQEELSGNLCRCTGYRPILDAAQHMASLPPAFVDTIDLLSKLELLAPASFAPEADLAYKLPQTLAELLQLRAAHPKAQLVAGCTDVGLWVTKQHRQFDQVIDLTQVAELRQINDQPQHLLIGAAVSLADAYAALVQGRPQLHNFASRFAGLPVRNSGTLGGNIANGSPIGDGAPALIALGADIVLRRGEVQRRMRLQDFYLDYMKNAMQPGEFVEALHLPLPAAGLQVRGYKISKRYDSDISAVCAALALRVETGVVAEARFAFGGMAAIVKRAAGAEAAVIGQPWTQASAEAAADALAQDFSPLSDVRASAAYRLRVAQNLLTRLWLETRDDAPLASRDVNVWQAVSFNRTNLENAA